MSTILVPVDFSETSDNATKYAIELANHLSANLTLLHVDSIPLVNNEFQDLSMAIVNNRENYLKLLNEKADDIKKEKKLRGEINYFAETGDLNNTIGFFIKEKNIDFIVMGVSGHHTKIGKFVLGSNAVSVSRESNIPVFIIPKDCQFKKIKNISYASEYDAGVEEYKALAQVKNINAIFGSQLFVIHVIPADHLINEQESKIDDFVEQKLNQISHRTFILTGNNVSKTIVDFIKAHQIDLVIVEQKEHSFLQNLFRVSTTKELAFNSPVPLLTIPN
ncbi:MAG: universal stress protein [Bacteroidota bacterium]|jgi:nucleotide-binding universal stress UspA family protein